MHRTLIALAGIFIFVLLTVPVMAADNDTVSASINVKLVWSIMDACNNVITFTIDKPQYDDGYCYPTYDPTAIHITSNQPYNVKIEYNCSGFPTGWHLWTKEGSDLPNNPSSPTNYEILDTGAPCYWATNQPPTAKDEWAFYYFLNGIEYKDDWVGNHSMGIVFTLAQL